VETTPLISGITTHLSRYPKHEIPRYEKLEIIFSASAVAENINGLLTPPLHPGSTHPGE
jgi:hypothetical protein